MDPVLLEISTNSVSALGRNPAKIFDLMTNCVREILKNPSKNPLELESYNLSCIFNLATNLLAAMALELFDINEPYIVHNNETYYNKGLHTETYCCATGKFVVARHVYQTAQGGRTFVPFERSFNCVFNATPLLAKNAAFKVAHMSAGTAKIDFDNLGISYSRDYLHALAEKVGQEVVKHEGFTYPLDQFDPLDKFDSQDGRNIVDRSYPVGGPFSEVEVISVSLDGTMINIKGQGYKEAMAGTISFIDGNGERLHTIYLASAPEAGKWTFLTSLASELDRAKRNFPFAKIQGIADGAPANWQFLDSRTEFQTLDFYHLSEHLTTAAKAMFTKEAERGEWLGYWLHRVKHTNIGSKELIAEIGESLNKYTGQKKDIIEAELKYLKNQQGRMKYATTRHFKMPIGSGVMEAACKTVIKQRLGISGAKWTIEGARAMLALRALILTEGRYNEFWKKTYLYGFQKSRSFK